MINIQNLYTYRSGLAESPIWDNINQCFYWIDIPKRQIHRHEYLNDQDGEHIIWQLTDLPENDPGTIALNQNGDLLVALRSGIALFDSKTPAGNISLTPFINAPYNQNEIRFNDGGVDTQGRWWIGTLFSPKTHNGASLFCLNQNKLTAVAGPHAAQQPQKNWGVITSNGWAMTADGQHMYHADTQAHTIYRYEINNTQNIEDLLQSRSVFYKAPNQVESLEQDKPYRGRPDGSAVDSAGNYWSAQFEGGHVIQFSAAGDIVQRIELPAKCPTMLCFGGSDLKTLIITTTGSRPSEELIDFPSNGFILKIITEVAGLPTHRYAF